MRVCVCMHLGMCLCLTLHHHHPPSCAASPPPPLPPPPPPRSVLQCPSLCCVCLSTNQLPSRSGPPLVYSSGLSETGSHAGYLRCGRRRQNESVGVVVVRCGGVTVLDALAAVAAAAEIAAAVVVAVADYGYDTNGVKTGGFQTST